MMSSELEAAYRSIAVNQVRQEGGGCVRWMWAGGQPPQQGNSGILPTAQLQEELREGGRIGEESRGW